MMEPIPVLVVNPVRLLGEEATIALNASGKFTASLLVPPLVEPLPALPPSSLVLVHLYTHRALLEQTVRACRQLAQAGKLRFLFLAFGDANRDAAVLKEALALGSMGFLDGNSLSCTSFWTALQAAAAGASLWQPEQLQLAAAPTEQPLATERLTRREQEVMQLLVEGLSDQEIAERLAVSVRTVQFHVHNILRKLGVSSRSKVISLVQGEHAA